MAYSREIEKLERQFSENPRRFAAPFADALRKSDEVPRALEVIRVGLELNPDYIPGSVILGRCHLDLGDDNAAEAAFSRVLDLDNENVIALKSLADIMERQGRTDEAVRFLAFLLDVDRSNDEAREHLARLQAVPAATSSPPLPPPAAAVDVPRLGAPEPPPFLPDPFFGAAPGLSATPSVSGPDEFLEPTVLWEPPVDAPEATISPWVEPTAAEQSAPSEFGESLVEEPMTGGGPAPVEGFEDTEFRAPAESFLHDEFVLEREEEIILTSLSGAEYQVANDSESLLDRESVAPPPAPAPAPAPEAPVEEPADTIPASVIAEELRATGADAGGLAEPTEDVEEEDESQWEPAPALAPDRGEAEEIEEDELAEPAPAPVLMVTESMAELYAVQGHPSEALGVYRILYDRNPDNERLRQRIQELEVAVAAQMAEDAAPSYAASVTGGQAVGLFLGALLHARPAVVDIPELAPAPETTRAAEGADAGDEAVASGEPTRPAIDRLSLGAVFGEDPSPVPPAEAAAGVRAEGSGGFSFDEFFGGADAPPSGRTSGGSVRAARAADDEDDLDQFHVWLQSLKR